VHPAGPRRERGVVDIGDDLLVFKMGEPQPPLLHRAAPGRGHGVERDHPGHLHDGRRPIRAPGSSALRPAHRHEEPVPGAAWSRGLGVRNAVGVPTAGGASCVSEGPIAGNPLVNVFCLGSAPKKRILSWPGREARGNPVISTWGKTGRDGIHGATIGFRDVRRGLGERRPTVAGGRSVSARSC